MSKKNKHPNSKQPKSEDALASLVTALDDVPIDAATVQDTVARLGIDVKAMAKLVREKVAAATSQTNALTAAAGAGAEHGGAGPKSTSSARDRADRIEHARQAYAKELEDLERRKAEPRRSREEQMAVFHALVAKAKASPQTVAMHFHKYETATDDELAEMIRSLRHLVGADDPEE